MTFPFAGIAAVAANNRRRHSFRPSRRYKICFTRLFFLSFAVSLLAIPRLKSELSTVLLRSNKDTVKPSVNTSSLLEGATHTHDDIQGTSRIREEDLLVKGNAMKRQVKLNNPCLGRPTRKPIPSTYSSPPVLFFLHIPKTAGTFMYEIVMDYANKTQGLACQFLFDGNRAGHSEYDMSIKPPPLFPEGSIERQAVDAFNAVDRPRKKDLYERGGCRTVRGHVTYSLRDALQVPSISFTVVRDPVERFVSMYEFVLAMIREEPRSRWADWMTGKGIGQELGNSSSILNRGFYDGDGKWIYFRNIGYSFHFYGVLHQLSGMTPVFEGVADPFPDQFRMDRFLNVTEDVGLFRISNAEKMAEAAKDNLCKCHILGSQSNMVETLENFFNTLRPYATWSDEKKKSWMLQEVERNAFSKTGKSKDSLSAATREELERRLHHEIEVVKFAEEVIAYRKSVEWR